MHHVLPSRTHQLTRIAMIVGLHILFSSWFVFAPVLSFLFTFILPLFGMYLVYRGDGFSYLLYAISIVLIQLLILPLPLDWFVLTIIPNVLFGGVMGWMIQKHFPFLMIFSLGSLTYFALFQGMDLAMIFFYDLSWSRFFTSIFSLTVPSNLLSYWFYAMAFFQLIVVWMIILPVLKRLKIVLNTALKPTQDVSFLILILSLYGFLMAWVNPSLVLWIIGPLLLYSTYQSLMLILFSTRKLRKRFLVGLVFASVLITSVLLFYPSLNPSLIALSYPFLLVVVSWEKSFTISKKNRLN